MGGPERRREALAVAEQPRNQPVVERPELQEIVFQRRPGQRQALAGADLPYAFRDGRRRILHRLRLVQHRDVIVMAEQRRVVPAEQRIGGDDQVMPGDFRESPLPVGAVQHRQLQVGHEARGFAPPVANQARRHHQEARKRRLLFQMPVCQQRERLQCLAKPHVVGQHPAEAGRRERLEPAVAGALVGTQFSLQRSRCRLLRRLGKRPEPCAQIEELPSAGPRRAATLQLFGQIEQAGRIGPIELQQPLRFEKRFGERCEPGAVEDEPGAVLKPCVKQLVGQVALDVEPWLQLTPFVGRQIFDHLQEERRHVEPLAVRLQRQADREPVLGRGLEGRRECHRPLVQPQPP